MSGPRAGIRAAVGGLPRPFWVLWSGMLVNRIGSFVVPFMAVYLTQARGMPVAVAGLVAALWGAGAAVASPLGGYVADHAGRRVTMITALVLGGTGMIALGFATRLEVIAPAVFVVAMLGECYRPAMQAAIADLIPAADRVRAWGLVYWAINLGVSIGLTLAGVLAAHSFLWLFVGDGLTSLVFAALVWRGVPETRPAHPAHAGAPHGLVRGFLAPYRDRPFLGFVFVSLAIFLVFMQHSTALPVDIAAHGIGRTALGGVLAVNGIAIVLLQPWLAPKLARFDRSRLLAAGAVLVGAGFGLNALVGTAPGFAFAVLVWTVGEIGVLPVGNAVVADVALPELRGRYQGAYGLCFGVAACLAPLAGTAVMQRAGSHVLWAGCFALGLLVAAGHLALRAPLARLRRARLAAGAPPATPA